MSFGMPPRFRCGRGGAGSPAPLGMPAIQSPVVFRLTGARAEFTGVFQGREFVNGLTVVASTEADFAERVLCRYYGAERINQAPQEPRRARMAESATPVAPAAVVAAPVILAPAPTVVEPPPADAEQYAAETADPEILPTWDVEGTPVKSKKSGRTRKTPVRRVP